MVYTGRPIYHYHICIIYIIFVDDIAAVAAGGHETAVSFTVSVAAVFLYAIIIYVADDRIHIYTLYICAAAKGAVQVSAALAIV